jgi:hypothetical protein
MITGQYFHRNSELAIFLIIRVEVVVGGNRRLLDVAPDVFQSNLSSNSVRFHNNSEHVYAIMGESLFGAL